MIKDKDSINNLLRFALHNSNILRSAIEPDNIENEIARNIHKLSLSSIPDESKAGKKLLKMTSDAGNKTSEALIESKSDSAKHSRKKRTIKEGYQSIRELLIAEWQSGRYRFRRDCAEDNYEKFGITYETAILYLTKIPKTRVN